MESIAEQFRYADYGDALSKLVTCLDFINSLPAFKSYKSASWQLLDVCPGGRFADVACGVGYDIEELAKRHPCATFVGIDHSQGFLDIARSRTSSLKNVRLIRSDATQLPFDNNSLDGIRIDRSLQHIKSPERVVFEMKRVTRPGGRILVCEPDWGTFVLFNGDNLRSETMAHTWASLFVNPFIGRNILNIYASQYIKILGFEAHVLAFRDYDEAKIVFDIPGIVNRCVKKEILSSDECSTWITQAQEASRRGSFLSMLTIVTVLGESA
jgi:ubiquinone/menaquinone biosynthesis C-methylase UbiE